MSIDVHNLSEQKSHKITSYKKIIILLSLFALEANAQAKPLRIIEGKKYPVCHEVVKRIENTPDFFQRFEQENYRYILFDSPFKRDDIEIVPKSLYYAARLQARAFKLIRQVNITLEFRNTPPKSACRDYPEHLQECEKEIMESFLKIDSEKRSVDFLNNAYLDNERAFAYKTKSNVYSHSQIEEYALGVVGHVPSGKRKGEPTGSFMVIDRYMRLHPDVNLDKQNKTAKDAGGLTVVPVDLAHRTFAMEISKSEGHWVIYITEDDFSDSFGGLGSTLICRILE